MKHNIFTSVSVIISLTSWPLFIQSLNWFTYSYGSFSEGVFTKWYFFDGKKLSIDILLKLLPKDDYPVLLHKGERVLTAQQNRQYNQGGSNVSIPKLADTIVVREDADIDKIASALVKKIKTNTISYGGVF